MNLRRKLPTTSLNQNDRKVLNKYTSFYTNMIESNTAGTDILEDESFKHKPRSV